MKSDPPRSPQKTQYGLSGSDGTAGDSVNQPIAVEDAVNSANHHQRLGEAGTISDVTLRGKGMR
jgi:hypothetical protein